MLQFNQITDLKDIHKSNKVHILSELQQKNPIVVHNLLPTYESLKQITLASIVQKNPGYIAKDGSKLISLDRFVTTDQMFIHNNSSMIDDFHLSNDLTTCAAFFQDKISCNTNHTLSIYKGHHSVSCQKNKHNILLIHQLYNSSTVYLINPKHNEDIKNKSNLEIKKWSYKLTLQSGQIICIPPEWLYFYETTNESILATTTSDNYFTCLFNHLR